MIQAPITRQAAHDVPLNQIEAELAHLWRESDVSTLANGGQVHARNSVMTLVAYVNGQEQAEYVARAIEGLTNQHPSRAIILALQPETQGASITASVSIHGHNSSHSGGQIRAEQIMIHVHGNAVQHVHSIVLPLLLTEMPTFVWWTGTLPSSHFIDTLIDESDRMIIDSADFVDPERDLARIAAIIQDQTNPHNSRTALSDFNWSRIKPWRELTAQFFDMPRYRPFLDGVERIEVEYAVENGQVANPIQAYLLAGWLASRLKWQAYTRQSGAGNTRLGLHTQPGAPVTLEIIPRTGIEMRDWWETSSAEWPVQLGGQSNETDEPTIDEQMQPQRSVSRGALMRVTLQARYEGKTASFSIVRDADMKSATTVAVADGEPSPQRCTPLDSQGETSLLHQQLSIFDHMAVYEEAVRAAGQMVSIDMQRTGRSR